MSGFLLKGVLKPAALAGLLKRPARAGVVSMVWLLFVACGETTSVSQGPQRQDLGTQESVEASEERNAARIEDLEARVAALERKMTEIANLGSMGREVRSARESDRRVAAQVSRQSPATALGIQSGQAVKESTGPGQAVDFTHASEGQIFPQYGSRNMIVKTSAGLGLTSASREPVDLVFSDFSLAERMEVIVSLRTGFWTGQQIRLLNDDRPVVAVTLSNYDLKFGDHSKKRSTTGWKRGEERNQLRIMIEDNNAWLYVNKRFFGVQEIELATANRLEISGIKRDQDFVYAVSVQPLS